MKSWFQRAKNQDNLSIIVVRVAAKLSSYQGWQGVISRLLVELDKCEELFFCQNALLSAGIETVTKYITINIAHAVKMIEVQICIFESFNFLNFFVKKRYAIKHKYIKKK